MLFIAFCGFLMQKVAKNELLWSFQLPIFYFIGYSGAQIALAGSLCSLRQKKGFLLLKSTGRVASMTSDSEIPKSATAP